MANYTPSAAILAMIPQTPPLASQDSDVNLFVRSALFQFVLEFGEAFNLSDDVRFRALELFNAFMDSVVNEVIELSTKQLEQSSSSSSAPPPGSSMPDRTTRQTNGSMGARVEPATGLTLDAQNLLQTHLMSARLRIITCISLATKLDSSARQLSIYEYAMLLEFQYTPQQIIQSELDVCCRLKFELRVPTVYNHMQDLCQQVVQFIHDTELVPVTFPPDFEEQLREESVRVLEESYMVLKATGSQSDTTYLQLFERRRAHAASVVLATGIHLIDEEHGDIRAAFVDFLAAVSSQVIDMSLTLCERVVTTHVEDEPDTGRTLLSME
ncbi:hypothetical protein CAOG_000166 [Capsaspora owczarzaki ATCC 30864]|uniref:Cyclin N-terminal domain-containing protein n=1 Tax=Capsaspora owczarzaki (strain ATCC 30864) TaxID=595528 RepID=A0A0D2X065_CAPO3|nr:hypothetical protein CAOG_000166 [Capsaspora owczarzaki ATCC 30864]